MRVQAIRYEKKREHRNLDIFQFYTQSKYNGIFILIFPITITMFEHYVRNNKVINSVKISRKSQVSKYIIWAIIENVYTKRPL